MAQIESLGLTAAVQDGTITAAEQLQWQTAFAANPDVTPANFRITATNPAEAEKFLANAIEQGFAPGTAIQLLEAGAQNAGIGADNLLLMTNAILSAAPASAATTAGIQAIQAEIAARLQRKKFSDALNESLRKIGATEKTTMIALMGVVAVIASLPETPKLDPLRVGKIAHWCAAGPTRRKCERASQARPLESSRSHNKSMPSLLRQRTSHHRREAFVAECGVARAR